ncbi:MAG TPA: hypothetical protein VKQ36_13725 [Ktedonobacterales bacterium]|nr:hypothetical protein [Ktedonobacterales bacterium]
MADALVIRLAREELVYLLRALRIPAIATLEPGPLITLEGDQLALALAVADRTLRARGMLHRGSAEQRQPDPVVVGLLRGLGQPRYTLMLDVRRSPESTKAGSATSGQTEEKPLAQRLIYSFASYAAIEQTQPEPGIHQFVALATPQDAFLRLHELIEVADADGSGGTQTPNAGAANGARGQLPQGEIGSDLLGEVNRLLAAGNTSGAQQALTKEVSPTLAQGLIAALASPRSFAQFALWPGLPLTMSAPAGQGPGTTNTGQLIPREPTATLIVAQGQEGAIYTLTQGDPSAPASGAAGERSRSGAHQTRIKVEQVTADQARAAMARILRPALDTLTTQSQASAPQ